MSELKFSSTEIKSWLENETRAILAPLHAQAEKLRNETRVALQSLADANKLLLDNSAKEIERRNLRVYNRARALNKLAHLFIERFKKLSIPDQISFSSLSSFAQETQKVFAVTEIDIKNWFPRISPFFIMDRRKFLTIYEKSKLTFTYLNDFLAKEYVKTKTLEETFQLISELQTLEEQLSNLAAQRESLRNERILIERETVALEQKIAELKSQGPIDQLHIIETNVEALNIEVRNELRHIQKPFIKMQALALQGGGAGLTPDEVRKLGQYLENPFEALAAEEAEYPVLKQILQKLAKLISEDKLKLKPEKAQKAKQAVGDIVNRNALADLQARCIRATEQKKQLLASIRLDEVKRQSSMLEAQIEQLKARRLSVEAQETAKAQEYNLVADRLRNHKNSVEKNVYTSIGKRVQIL
ncbi:MAG: hypothetical protein QXU99_00025 [Candidatus Bathyarchaeia archaeon]